MTAALALSALATTALAGDADASEPAWMQIVPSWAPSWLPQLAGRGHVVLVHFPIALLIVAALCEFWGAMRRQIDASRTGLTCLVLGALAAGVSAATGWINADLEGSRASMAETLSLHRWVGVAAAGAALVTALVVAPLLRPGGRGPLGLYRAGVVIAAMLVGVAGHFGGSLVHGENYFWSVIFPQSESASASDATKPAPWPTGMATKPGTIDFEKIIRPIFETRCVECHGPFKKKGGLRLDLRAGAFAHPSAHSIVPGKPDESDLLHRVTLPPSDPDFMPDGDKPLNPDEITALRTWISEGAHWPDDSAKLAELQSRQRNAELDEGIRSAFEDAVSIDSNDPREQALVRRTKERVAKIAADAIRAKHGVVVDLGADDPRLSVDLSVIAPPIGDADLPLLENLRPTIAWLNLSRTAITDAGLVSLKGLPELERLRLEWTAIGDSGLDFAATCAKLGTLNLVGTKMTDAGLAKLVACKQLRKLFVWKTGVTPEGIAKFKAARPEVEVVEGVQ
ncbi:MAG: hypothetical protein IT434_10235 [Phycisphaerales bacterium]|jgi:uncharacterized membrane protein|nr:hypothetical protein [Phycisphaerales bacterium]